MDHNDTTQSAGVGLVVLSWGSTIYQYLIEHSSEIITKANVSFLLSCIVSVMAIRHYYVYVDRFLFNMPFPQWAVLQTYPAMYSTESGSNYTHRLVTGSWDMGGDNGK